MEIQYNNKPVQYNQFLSPSQTNSQPLVKINDLGYKYYTLIMYDPDAVKGIYWHWILANIVSSKQIDTKNVLLEYKGPNPPDAKKHRYIFELYGTHDKIKLKSFGSRIVSLDKAKQLLNLENEHILKTHFLSERENKKGGKYTRKRMVFGSKNIKNTTKQNKKLRKSSRV